MLRPARTTARGVLERVPRWVEGSGRERGRACRGELPSVDRRAAWAGRAPPPDPWGCRDFERGRGAEREHFPWGRRPSPRVRDVAPHACLGRSPPRFARGIKLIGPPCAYSQAPMQYSPKMEPLLLGPSFTVTSHRVGSPGSPRGQNNRPLCWRVSPRLMLSTAPEIHCVVSSA